MQREAIKEQLKKDQAQVALAVKKIEEGNTFISVHTLVSVTRIATDWMQKTAELLGENERLHATITGQMESIREQTKKLLDSHSRNR